MALSMTVSLDGTGASFVAAYGRIEGTQLDLAAGQTKAFLIWYASLSAAASGMLPVKRDTVLIAQTMLQNANPTFVSGLQTACGNGSIVTPQDALKTALYLLIKQLPAYTGAVDA